MTPAARIQAAIGILDDILDGVPAERALTTWGRRSRFAGSGDRAAVRDHVFDALRRRRSCAWIGGAETGRGLMLGALRAAGRDPADLFTGQGHAPAPLTRDETATRDLSEAPPGVRLDMPDWLLPELARSLGPLCDQVALAMRERAPVFLRCNLSKAAVPQAIAALREEGIEAVRHPLSDTALEVTANARRIRTSAAYAGGLVELQDAASQAVVDALPLRDGLRVLDYCAGGGGKALAMAARCDLDIWAHDADPGRMADLPVRARRAGADISIVDPGGIGGLAPFDLVLCDAPCSGSGAWRRSPAAKWALTQGDLDRLCAVQSEVLASGADLVRTGGFLAYATCSLLAVENEARIEKFLSIRSGWRTILTRRLTPLDGGDGFFLQVLAREPAAV